MLGLLLVRHHILLAVNLAVNGSCAESIRVVVILVFKGLVVTEVYVTFNCLLLLNALLHQLPRI